MNTKQLLVIVLAIGVALSSVAVVRRDVRRVPVQVTNLASLPSLTSTISRQVALIDFLPAEFVTDGSVNYGNEARAAFAAAAGGVLVLPNFPVLVSRAPGQNWCIRVDSPLAVQGSTCSVLVEREGAVQLLRVQGVAGFTMRDVTLRGRAVQGQGLAHGLLQVFGGRDIAIERVRVDGCDADGIVVAGAEGVCISGCAVAHASKSAIYVNNSRRARVVHNEVIEFGGHRTPAGTVVGAGIQLSSNTDLVCSHNIVQGGVGVGILLNALEGGTAPVGSLVTENRITAVSNPTNPNVSSGIRLANGSGDGRTQTIVSSNSLRGCGTFGIYVENHHGALVTNNSIVESERCGILVSSVQDAVVTGNIVLNSGTSDLRDTYQVQLINRASGVIVRDNTLADLGGYEPGTALDAVSDTSQGAPNNVEPRFEQGVGPRFKGASQIGDVIVGRTPTAGGHIGWVCVHPGEPGVWRPFGRIEF